MTPELLKFCFDAHLLLHEEDMAGARIAVAFPVDFIGYMILFFDMDEDASGTCMTSAFADVQRISSNMINKRRAPDKRAIPISFRCTDLYFLLSAV
jgi:hypothetical protein